MATYTAIANGEIDAESPITDLLLGRLRDNPIAIAENDATVPASLRSVVLLATLATTSGTAWTASALNLNPFAFLMIHIDGFSVTAGGLDAITMNPGAGVFTIATTHPTTPASSIWALRLISTDSGMLVGDYVSSQAEGTTNARDSGLRRSTASITFAANARTGDAGSIKLYGVK
jgi:hypothetical protein